MTPRRWTLIFRPMKPFIRIAPATLSLEDVRARLERLGAQHQDLSDEFLELSVELFQRTDGGEGIDPRLREFLRLYKPVNSQAV